MKTCYEKVVNRGPDYMRKRKVTMKNIHKSNFGIVMSSITAKLNCSGVGGSGG